MSTKNKLSSVAENAMTPPDYTARTRISTSSRSVLESFAGEPVTPMLADNEILRPLQPQGLVGGKIPVAAYELGLKVLIPVWTDWEQEGAKRRDLWRLLVNDVDATEEAQLGPFEDITEFEATFPADTLKNLPDGTIRLSYGVTAVPADTPASGRTITVIKDTEAPGGKLLGAIQFPRDIVEGGLSSGKLTELGDVLTGQVNDYFGMAEGDFIYPFVMDASLISDPIDPAKAVAAAPVEVIQGRVGSIVDVLFTRAQLEEAEAGPLMAFFYYVDDNLGQRSLIAPLSLLQTQLKNAPGGLEPPRIDRFDDDGIINEQDARAPVVVTIPHYENAAEGDEVKVFWGLVEVATATLGPVDDEADDVAEIEVPYRNIVRSPERYSLDVTYKVRRNGIEITSPPLKDVLVDLTTSGGPDPDPETPQHDDLGKLTIRGATATEDNLISPADAKVDATATIPGMTVPTPPGISVPAFAEGDLIRVIWPGSAIGEPHIVEADEVGNDLSIVVPSALMLEAGAGIRPVSYSATRLVKNADGDDIENTAYAPAQGVLVLTEEEQPGGPGGLGLGKFTEANRFNGLNKAAAESDGGTPFLVELYANKAIDDVIRLDFVQYKEEEEEDHTSPIEASRYTASHIVGKDDEATGYNFLISTGKLILTAPDQGQSAKAFYTVTTSAGFTVTAEATFVYIDMR